MFVWRPSSSIIRSGRNRGTPPSHSRTPHSFHGESLLRLLSDGLVYFCSRRNQAAICAGRGGDRAFAMDRAVLSSSPPLSADGDLRSLVSAKWEDCGLGTHHLHRHGNHEGRIPIMPRFGRFQLHPVFRGRPDPKGNPERPWGNRMNASSLPLITRHLFSSVFVALSF